MMKPVFEMSFDELSELKEMQEKTLVRMGSTEVVQKYRDKWEKPLELLDDNEKPRADCMLAWCIQLRFELADSYVEKEPPEMLDWLIGSLKESNGSLILGGTKISWDILEAARDRIKGMEGIA